jgi:cap1 methyltransferase
VDLCGAPGGFSQYILFRCKEHEIETDHPIGYGMSLGGVNSDGMGIKWNKALHCGNEKRFKIHFGSDGTGDIYNWENVLSLQRTIYKDWNRSRVNLVVADGGFDAQRDCKDQEGVATNLVICQVAAAFQLLEYGGNFVLKLFGFQSAAIRYVMETLMVQFETVKIVKPIASRPASAERYVVGLGFRQCGKWKDLDTATELDAFVWRRDGLIMDQKVIIEEDVEDETKKRALYEWLDRFDCDIASLNIDACEKILHCLQIQQQRFLIGDRRRKKSKMKHVMAEPKIDVQHIRKMWHL